MFSYLKNKVVLVTGGTGSFGSEFTRIVLDRHNPKKLIVFSRDEWKQHQMSMDLVDPRIRFFLGDVRDYNRLLQAFEGVDVVIHAAALKQVPTLEYNPFEAVKTNVIAAENIINAAIERKVQRIVALSTDKAVNPINLYGATKLCAEKLFINGNNYAGKRPTLFSLVRYGNVVGSRGSVVPLFLKEKIKGTLPITDERMTRFWITLQQGVELVINCLARMEGGEIFIPKIPSMRVVDLASAMAPECKLNFVGIRPGEKIHEILMTENESSKAIDFGSYYIIYRKSEEVTKHISNKGNTCPPGFEYTSDSNKEWLNKEKLQEMLRSIPSVFPSRLVAQERTQ